MTDRELLEKLVRDVTALQGHARNCVNTEIVRQDCIRKLNELQTDWRETRATVDRAAVRTFEDGIHNAVREFAEPLSVCKEVRDLQRKVKTGQEVALESKIARDLQVVRFAKIVGAILVVAEISRTLLTTWQTFSHPDPTPKSSQQLSP